MGSKLRYDNGAATGSVHSYEIIDEDGEGLDWNKLPEPGKQLNFHYWLAANRWRRGWAALEGRDVTAGPRGSSSL